MILITDLGTTEIQYAFIQVPTWKLLKIIIMMAETPRIFSVKKFNNKNVNDILSPQNT